MKVQLIVNSQSTEVVHPAFSNGKTHDFSLFEQHRNDFPPEVHFYADSGYEGLDKLFPNSFTAYKKTKNKSLTDFQKIANCA